MAGETRIAEDDVAEPRTGEQPRRAARESARYLELAGEQVYTVAHTAARPRRGAVLLCGPFGVERERAYLTLVRWARTLAASGFDVLRFDYRGTGESSGRFEDMTFAHWREDAAHCAARLARARVGAGLVLHGTRMGALLAAELFAAGIGDGLLLWEPPVSAEALLRDTLRHHLISQRMAEPKVPLRGREPLIEELVRGGTINVDGYFWTHALWQEARGHVLRRPAAGETRPWLELRIQGPSVRPPATPEDPHVQSVDSDTFWGSSSRLLVPRSADFVRASLRWLAEHRRAHGSRD